MRRKRFYIVALIVFLLPLVLPSLACQQGGSGDLGPTIFQAWNNVREWFIMSGANNRIEKIRKGDAAILVVDDNGTPVRGARIYFEQLNHEFLFGSGMLPLTKNGPNAVNQDWAEAYTALFNYGTLPCYWDSYEPKEGQTSESLLMSMADWARKRGIVTKGHPLIWANSMPPWAPVSIDDMQRAQEKRVKDTVSKLCGMIDYWDVVNEPTMGPRVNNALGNWMNARTPQVACADALGWSRSACPKASLIINDYRTDIDFRDLLQNIVRQRGRFDAVGIQSHMHRGNWPLYQVWDICERFKDLDVPLHFTEVTVLSGSPRTGIDTARQPSDWPSTKEGEMAQAEYVEKFYTLLFSNPSVQAITWWDFSDLDAWQGAPAGLLRKDMSQKPAYSRLLKLIHDTWWSRGNVYTGDDGIATIRGFHGFYKLNIEKEDKRAEAQLYIARGLDNKLRVQLTGYKQKPPTPLYEMIWPYAVAALIIVLLVLIFRWIAQIRRRI